MSRSDPRQEYIEALFARLAEYHAHPCPGAKLRLADALIALFAFRPNGSLFAVEPHKKKMVRPEIGAVLLYCGDKGLLAADGQWFFAHCEGNGWTNGGKPIRNWQQTIVAWQLAGIFPSQKLAAKATQAAAVTQSESSRKLQRLVGQIERDYAE